MSEDKKAKTYTEEEFGKKLTQALDVWKDSHFRFNIKHSFGPQNGNNPRVEIELLGGDPAELFGFALSLERHILDYASRQVDLSLAGE